jgi:hypothetical protein
MAHAAPSGQPIGHFLDGFAAATQYRHFQAAVMVEMHMRRGDAEAVVVVLGVDQALAPMAGPS